MVAKSIKIAAAGLGTMIVLGGGLAVAAAAGADPVGGLLDKHPRIERLADLKGSGRLLHTETTYRGADDKPMTVTAISGSVTTVSATSITVTSSDGVADTFAVDDGTKVSLVDPSKSPKLSSGTIADVKTGASVVVSARGAAGAAGPATRILVRP